jgi:hypothetical protein
MKSKEMPALRTMVGAVSISLVATLGAMPSAIAEAQYPPSIQAPTTGETIQTPVPPKTSGAKVVVPVATSEVIPDLVKAPVPVSRAALNSNGTLNLTRVTTRPVEVFSGVAIGGLSASDLKSAPTANLSNVVGKKVELQVASDVPTVVALQSLPKSANAQVVLVNSRGNKTISLGTLRTTSKGRLTLPPVTLDDKGDAFTLRIVISGRTTNISVRATN